MPPRPHPIVLTALVVGCAFVALLVLPGGLAHARGRPPAPRPAPATWRWPLRGPVLGSFRVTPRAPYARGQRRGIDVAAAPGSEVRAVCAGRVTFTGALPRLGRAITVRCGPLVATYLRLGRVVVHRGAVVAPGQPLATVGPAGVLRLGARRATDRRGYLDPLTLLRDPAPAPPDLGPAPRSRTPRPPATIASRPLPAVRRTLPLVARRRPLPAKPHASRLPWPAYPALALIATAVPVGGLVRRSRRHARLTETAEVA